MDIVTPHDPGAERRYHLIAEHSNDMVTITGPDERWLYVSPASQKIFGQPPEALLGLHTLDFVHPDDRQAMLDRIEQLRIGRGEQQLPLFRIVRRDGTLVWIEASTRIVNQSATGGQDGWVSVLRDVTAREQAKAALAASEARYHQIAEVSTDMIVVVDRHFIRRYVSSGSVGLIGYEPEELIGLSAISVTHPDDRAKIETAFQSLTAKRGHDRDRISYRVLHRDGHIVWVDAQRWVSAYDENDLPSEACWVLRDISEFVATREALAMRRDELQRVVIELNGEIAARRATEAALTEAKEIAEQASHAKSRFVALVSHELRTPLNGILGYAQLLKMEGGLTPRQSERVGAMTAAGKHLLELIERVLDFSGLEVNRIELRLTQIVIKDLAESCLDFVGPAAEEKGLDLRLIVTRRAPRSIMVDAGRLRQIVINLLGNAVKFTDTGSVELRLLTAAEGALRIEIADTGRGVPAGTEDRLFREFERLDRGSAIEGAGLGLAISMGLVRLMGGTIGYSPNPGGGSIFWAELPVSAGLSAPPPAVEIMPDPAPGPGLDRTGPALDILVVDDMAMNRDVVSSMVRAAGHRVECAVNGEQAWKMAAEQDFNLILMDVRMPIMDGLEATRRIRALPGRRGQVPVIALTAHAFAEQIAKSQQAGMNAHISKPVDNAGLLKAIRDLARPSASENIEESAGLSGFHQDILNETAQCLDPAKLAAHLAGLSKNIETMLTAISNWDIDPSQAEAAIEAVHTIAGSAGSFGYMRLSDRARHFERALITTSSEREGPRDALLSDARWALGHLTSLKAHRVGAV